MCQFKRGELMILFWSIKRRGSLDHGAKLGDGVVNLCC